ncbi:MAG: aminotransferase class III-fold pyridoxal phosphate-dependent enzyme, partial [Syntrophales bacterium LBB04]|nr:aminotransferase class III-fold pyridoxal phosphate-dependent enzyme [Syntrophales bacterium LBB04]
LQEVCDLTHKHGALFIMDELITGFRYALGGAREYLGVTPDLASFGKSMGNGMPIAAIVGKAKYMRLMEDVFVSFTFGGEALSLAASIAVIDKMRREPVIETLWASGRKLADGVKELIKKNNLEDFVSPSGLPPWTIVGFKPHANADGDTIKTFFIQKMLENGVLIHTNHNVCYAHSEEDLRAVLAAYERVLALLREELEKGRMEDRLPCPVIRPVFSVR